MLSLVSAFSLVESGWERYGRPSCVISWVVTMSNYPLEIKRDPLCLAWTRGPRVICDSRSDLLPSFWIAFGADMLSQRIVEDVKYLFIA